MASKENTGKIDCHSKKFLARISRDEVNRLRESRPEIFENRDKMGAMVTELAANRVLAESFDTPKMLITAKYPLKLAAAAPCAAPGGVGQFNLLDSLPWALELQETWLFFEDKSVLLICSPSQETRSCSRFFMELTRNSGSMELAGLDGIDVSSLGNLISLGSSKRHLMPMNHEEFKEHIDTRLMQSFSDEARPSFWINLSPRSLGHREMLGFLLQAAENATDTMSSSVNAKINAIAEKALNEMK